MRILVPVMGDGKLDNTVSHVFSKAYNFILVSVSKGKITRTEAVPNMARGIKPFEVAERTARAAAAGAKASVVLADLIDQDAAKVLEKAHIQVETGYGDMTARKAVQKYLRKLR